MIILCRWLRYYEFHVLKYKETSKLLCWDSWINIRHCSTIFESNELCPCWVFFSYFSYFDLIRRLKFKSNMHFEKKKPIWSLFSYEFCHLCILFIISSFFKKKNEMNEVFEFIISVYQNISILYRIQGVKLFDRYR